MAEISERTRLEQIAGKRARLRYAQEIKIPLHEMFTMFDGRVKLVDLGHDYATIEVTSTTPGQSIRLTEPLLDFPSDTLLTQCTLVAG